MGLLGVIKPQPRPAFSGAIFPVSLKSRGCALGGGVLAGTHPPAWPACACAPCRPLIYDVPTSGGVRAPVPVMGSDLEVPLLRGSAPRQAGGRGPFRNVRGRCPVRFSGTRAGAAGQAHGAPAGPVPLASLLAGAFGSDVTGWPTTALRVPFRKSPCAQCQAVHVGGLGKAGVCAACSRNHAALSRRSAGVRSRAARTCGQPDLCTSSWDLVSQTLVSARRSALSSPGEGAFGLLAGRRAAAGCGRVSPAPYAPHFLISLPPTSSVDLSFTECPEESKCGDQQRRQAGWPYPECPQGGRRQAGDRTGWCPGTGLWASPSDGGQSPSPSGQ